MRQYKQQPDPVDSAIFGNKNVLITEMRYHKIFSCIINILNINYSKKLFFIVFCLCLHGCASTKIYTIPEIKNSTINKNFYISGILKGFKGNRDYVPDTIKENDETENIFICYKYVVLYQKDNMHQAIPLFNPLTIIGVPIGKNSLIVEAKLSISNKTKILIEYVATCHLKKDRNIFHEGETYSEMRKKGLLAVKKNIEYQMNRDKQKLLDFLE